MKIISRFRCIYVCICICMCIYIYIYIYSGIYAFVYIYIYMCVCMYVCMYVCACMYLCIYVYYLFTYLVMYVCIPCMHAHSYVCRCVYTSMEKTQTYRCKQKKGVSRNAGMYVCMYVKNTFIFEGVLACAGKHRPRARMTRHVQVSMAPAQGRHATGSWLKFRVKGRVIEGW